MVTDPNPPIRYGDLYTAIKVLSRHTFMILPLPPVLMLLMSHAIELYSDLPFLPFPLSILGRLLPPLRGDARHLKPGIFSITTHLVGSNSEISRPVSEGGLGYQGVMTTLEGMALEILEWNREHENLDDGRGKMRKAYTTSISLAEKIQKLGAAGYQAATQTEHGKKEARG